MLTATLVVLSEVAGQTPPSGLSVWVIFTLRIFQLAIV
jgi:hypothetical protein